MSQIAPSREALRHLSRLCRSHLSKQTTPRPRTSYCIASTHEKLCKVTHPTVPTQCKRMFTSTADLKQPKSHPNDNKTDPQIRASPTLPDISSYYTLFPQTMPDGPPPTGSFKIPLPALRKEFLSLQSQHHPDKYTAATVAHQKSLALSALINAAYKTLSDPLLRAQYLLQQLYGIDVTSEDNSSHPTDQATLMEVMEVQEAFEDVTAHEEMETLKENNRRRLRETEDKMGTAFENDEKDVAKDECVRLNYWRSLQSGLDDWEPGKEVRLVH